MKVYEECIFLRVVAEDENEAKQQIDRAKSAAYRHVNSIVDGWIEDVTEEEQK